MSFNFSEIKINKNAVKALLSGHPWIYRSKVLNVETQNPWVYISHAQTMYYGIFEELGSVAVRIFSKSKKPTIESLSYKINSLFDTRKEKALHKYGTNAFRLIHGEVDQFPGLSIDVFDNLLVVQPYLKAWESILPDILKSLIQKHDLYCYVKLPKQRDKGKSGYFIGKELNKEYIDFKESNYRFASFFISGQKTGFYLDLRELRIYISTLELSGKKVLDLCASDGSLSLIMKNKGADVHSVEISQACVERSKINHELNNLVFDPQKWETNDVWEKIKNNTNQKYDLIILDPPNLATSKEHFHNAIRAWKQLNTYAIENIAQGGTIISCNCSSRLTKEIHKKSIVDILKNRNIKPKEFIFLKHTFDHPVSDKIPELNYLDISILVL